MTVAVVYRWTIWPGQHAEFEAAWAQATAYIHSRCGSYGARLHRAVDGDYWSYARWPSEPVRQACFDAPHRDRPACFEAMRACVRKRHDEVVLRISQDALSEPCDTHAVPTLRTDRLVLRALALDDAPSLHAALGDPGTMTYWSRGPLDSVQATRDYLRWNVEGEGVQCFAVTLADHVDDALGWVVLMDKRADVVEIGFILRPDARGQGIGREAVAAVVAYGFGERKLRRIEADTDPENEASIGLLRSLGFEREGLQRGTWKTHLGVRDSAMFGLLITA